MANGEREGFEGGVSGFMVWCCCDDNSSVVFYSYHLYEIVLAFWVEREREREICGKERKKENNILILDY